MPSAGPAWLTDARTAVERATSEKEFQNRLDSLIDVDASLDGFVAALSEFTASTTLDGAAWWTGAEVPENISTEITAVRKGIMPRHWTRLRSSLDRLIPAIKSDVRASWQRYVASRTGGTEELQGLLRVLSGVRGLADIATTLGELLDEITRLRRKLPDAHGMEAVEMATALLDDLAARLPDDVKEFVSAAARGGGAPLELLSPAVLTWLDTNGATGEFRIVVAGRRTGE
jgi:hypothetical protein